MFVYNREYLVDNIDLRQTILVEKLVEKRLLSTEQIKYIQVFFYLILSGFKAILN